MRGPACGVGWNLRNHWDGANSVSQVNGLRYGTLLPALLGGLLRKETMASAKIFAGEKAVPPALALLPFNSVLPPKSLAPLELLP